MPAPLATYRVQLHAGFTFDDLGAVVPYLRRLGVTHVYCSPYLQAAPGSTHGYDVVDHGRVNAELGGRAGLERLHAELAAHEMGQVVDIVPNHMAVAGRANRWWWDVLENGPASRWAHFFDIDWDPPEQKLAATVLVPVLGDHYGRVLEAGELVVTREGGSFAVRYHEHEVPVSPRTLDGLLAAAAQRCGSDELAFLARAHERLPRARDAAGGAVEERHRDKEILRAQLGRLCQRDPQVATAVDEEVARLNADVDALDELLGRQNYRLAYWRTAGRELDYRRFFDINTLVALRVEDEEVFASTHSLIAELVGSGVVDGLRVDHIDGLRDPLEYLERLRDRTGAPYVVVEKILEGDERLPDGWPVAGTTGYDFLNEVNRLLVDPAAEAAFTSLWEEVAGDDRSWHEVEQESKRLVLGTVLAADVERLAARFAVVCEGRRRYRDFTRAELRDALHAVAAAFPVYRTYARLGAAPSPTDRDIVAASLDAASKARPDLDRELLDFLGRILVLDVGGPAESDLALRFQQLTGPVMAKAVEDTGFYRYLRFASLNEVGGDPGRFGSHPDEAHRAFAHRAASWPASMLTLSTHDTKRSADVRARMGVLSEIPEAWAAFARERLSAWESAPWAAGVDAVTQYLALQTLAGAWPIDGERLADYLEKATREAKLHTSWTDPDPAYDDAVGSFARAVVTDAATVAALEHLLESERILEAGLAASLAQTTLLLTAPGVPDLYQGTETVDLSLVDPDNRRPVDHPSLERALSRVTAMPGDAAAALPGAERKLWLVSRLLDLRRQRESLHPGGTYTPLPIAGEGADRAIAFLRGDDVAVVTATRGRAALDGWSGTSVELPAGTWTSTLTGAVNARGSQALASVLAVLPVDVLVRG